jgi:hypothetical protein
VAHLTLSPNRSISAICKPPRAKQMVDNRVFDSLRKYHCFVDFCSRPMART